MVEHSSYTRSVGGPSPSRPTRHKGTIRVPALSLDMSILPTTGGDESALIQKERGWNGGQVVEGDYTIHTIGSDKFGWLLWMGVIINPICEMIWNNADVRLWIASNVDRQTVLGISTLNRAKMRLLAK